MREVNDTMPAANEAEGFSLATSRRYERAYLGDRLACSTSIGWTSLLVEVVETRRNLEAFETLSSPHQMIVLVTQGEREIESFSNRSWKKAVDRPGFGGLTPADKIDRIRWRVRNADSHRTVYIFVPEYFFALAREEFRRAGTAHRPAPLDALLFYDPVITQVGLSLIEAMQNGAPNLYAESAAQFLATRLLSPHSPWLDPLSGARYEGKVSDRRLARVLEFMEHHYAENLSLAELAREAGISRFYFIKLFKQCCGVTPHQHLINLRMTAAASFLEDINLNTEEIAVRCGYADAKHFTIAFKKHFSNTPAEYRKNR